MRSYIPNTEIAFFMLVVESVYAMSGWGRSLGTKKLEELLE